MMKNITNNRVIFTIGEYDSGNNVVTLSQIALTGHFDPGESLPITFSLDLTLPEGSAVETPNGDDISSRGVKVKYAVVGSDILGFADANSNGLFNSGDRQVFAVTDNGDGSFSFKLLDQIDHDSDVDTSGVSLDMGVLFDAQDGDGDKIEIPASTLSLEIQAAR